MNYFKILNDSYVITIGKGANIGIKITEQEYNTILDIIHNAPVAPEGYQYKLRDDTLEWEMIEIPPIPEPSEEATEEDYQNALEQMGVNFDEDS